MDFGQGTLKRKFVFPVSLNINFNCFFSNVSSVSCCPLSVPAFLRGSLTTSCLLGCQALSIFCVHFSLPPGTGQHTNGNCLLRDSPTQKIPWDVWSLIFYLTSASLAILLKMLFCFVCHMLSTILNYSALKRIALYSCSVVFIEPEFLAFFFFSFLAEFFIPSMVCVTNFD